MIAFKLSYGDDAIPDSDEIDQHALREEERLIEYELQLKESKIESKQFPKKCHGKFSKHYSLKYFISEWLDSSVCFYYVKNG